MAADITPITDRKQPDDLDPFDVLCEAVHRIDHRTAAMERRLDEIGRAWERGGLRGLREALKGSHGH